MRSSTVAVYPFSVSLSLTQLEAKGLEVLMKEERQLTKEEAAEFYKQHEGSVSAAREVWPDVWPYACMCTCNFMAKGCICIKSSCFSSFLQEHFEELLEFMSRYIPVHCFTGMVYAVLYCMFAWIV